MVLFGPWAFGTTQTWSLWVMNIAGYGLGVLWLLKYAIAAVRRYRLPAWGLAGLPPAGAGTRLPISVHHWPRCTLSLATLTVMLLLYCLISALNARATSASPLTSNLDYHDCIGWLPHSFNSKATWFAFWTYLGLACAFWSIRDWLLAKSACEQLASYNSAMPIEGVHPDIRPSHRIPEHAARLLTLLTINGGLLALEAIIQRLADSPKLLFLVTPEIHRTAITQFGPYAYRANAAQYFNLLWPVGLGFWWTRRAETGPGLRHCLLSCVGLMAAASLMSASKGGVLVCTGVLFIALSLAVFVPRPGQRVSCPNRGLTFCLLAFLVLGFCLGWKEFLPGISRLDESIERRQRIYFAARQMSRDLGVFGSGPGTYETISELYRPASPGFWPAQVHNDWLEMRITFGWPGSVLILASLGVLLGRWFLPGGLPVGPVGVGLSWLALTGCLTHAAFDFPFQIHSILFLFVVIGALLFTASARPWKN